MGRGFYTATINTKSNTILILVARLMYIITSYNKAIERKNRKPTKKAGRRRIDYGKQLEMV